MSKILILNADAQPLGLLPLTTISWEEAIKLVWLNEVTILSEYEDWFVHSPSISMKVPSIIALKTYIKPQRSVTFNKYNVTLRDEYKCQYCMADYSSNPSLLTYDHVVPKKLGGKTSWRNIVSACSSCNMEKSHYMKMKPTNEPKKPTYHELVNKRRKFPLVIHHKDWNDYLGWDEDLIAIL